MRVDTGRLRVVNADVAVARPVEGEAQLGADSPGRYIREQRLRKGMSLEQLAAATKIPLQQLTRLEEDTFDDMHGMVFVKGFYRCCARVLHLDAEHVLGLLYERERSQLKDRRREVATRPEVRPSGISRALPAMLTGARTVTLAVLVLVIAALVIVAFTLAGAGGGAPGS